jgi:hypothetical protein
MLADPMPMRRTTINFPARLWALIGQEARRQGISNAQFIRETLEQRITLLRTNRGEPIDHESR